jgi:hypothetical protein
MRDKITEEKHEWKIIDQEAELALNGLTICPNEFKAHQLTKYRTELTQKAPSMVCIGRCEPNEAKIMCDMLLEMKIKYGMVPSLDRKGAITSLEWIVWKEAAKNMKIHRSIPKPLRWSKTIGVGWNSWWMDISTARLNGSVVYFNVGLGPTFLGRCCSTRQELYFQLFFEKYFGR